MMPCGGWGRGVKYSGGLSEEVVGVHGSEL